MTVERHDFTTTPECPWCGERECERHCAECGRERYYRDGRHRGDAETVVAEALFGWGIRSESRHQMVEDIFAALAEARYATVALPVGVAVEHGERMRRWGSANGQMLYTIKGETA